MADVSAAADPNTGRSERLRPDELEELLVVAVRRHQRVLADHRVGVRAGGRRLQQRDAVRASGEPARHHQRQQRDLPHHPVVQRPRRLGRADRTRHAERHRGVLTGCLTAMTKGSPVRGSRLARLLTALVSSRACFGNMNATANAIAKQATVSRMSHLIAVTKPCSGIHWKNTVPITATPSAPPNCWTALSTPEPVPTSRSSSVGQDDVEQRGEDHAAAESDDQEQSGARSQPVTAGRRRPIVHAQPDHAEAPTTSRPPCSTWRPNFGPSSRAGERGADRDAEGHGVMASPVCSGREAAGRAG